MANIGEQKLVSLLERYDIPYWLSGKNVSEDCIGISCPFCEDRSNHCGIFKEHGNFSCWRCEETGSLFKLLNKLTNISYDEYEELVEGTVRYASAETEIKDILEEDKVASKEVTKISLPNNAKCITTELYESGTVISNALYNFLVKRRITLETCIKNYCHVCTTGKYALRMIVPILYERRIVGF